MGSISPAYKSQFPEKTSHRWWRGSEGSHCAENGTGLHLHYMIDCCMRGKTGQTYWTACWRISVKSADEKGTLWSTTFASWPGSTRSDGVNGHGGSNA